MQRDLVCGIQIYFQPKTLDCSVGLKRVLMISPDRLVDMRRIGNIQERHRGVDLGNKKIEPADVGMRQDLGKPHIQIVERNAR